MATVLGLALLALSFYPFYTPLEDNPWLTLGLWFLGGAFLLGSTLDSLKQWWRQ